jgi:hypothetical protein
MRRKENQMRIAAKFASQCPECGKLINVGESVEYRRGQKAIHPECYREYFEIRAGGGKIGVFARNLEAAKTEVARLVAVGCDAEYCPDREHCEKEHYHDINCRCGECFAAEEEI